MEEHEKVESGKVVLVEPGKPAIIVTLELSEDDFTGLSDEQAKLYSEKFRDVQEFIRRPDGGLTILVHHVVEEEQ